MTRRFSIAKAAALLPLLSACAIALLSACANDPTIRKATSQANPAGSDAEKAAALTNTKVLFHYSDFYSITAPDADTGCAGDAKTLYEALELSGGSAATLPQSSLDASTTIRPAFIKNIAVDLTDSNAPVSSNMAYSCSYGTGPAAPPVSSCASFDYGAVGGVPTTLGGTLFLVGGMQDYNYSGILPTSYQSAFPPFGYSVSCGPVKPASTLTAPYGFNRCDASVFALGINTLPSSAATNPPNSLAPGLTSADGPISTWNNLSSANGFSGPRSLAGASSAFDSALHHLAIFGGAAPLSGTPGLANPSAPTFDTWTFDFKDQSWSKSANVYVDTSIIAQLDNAGTQTLQLAKAVGGRSLFGYASVPGMSLSQMSPDGNATSANIDTTDRILIAGGLGPNGVLADLHKFNPTYGPEYADALGRAPAGFGPPPTAISPVGALEATQWMDSYHTQLMSNSDALVTNSLLSQMRPDFTSDGTLNYTLGFGLAPLRNNSGGPGTGYVLFAGGFDTATNVNTPSNGCTLANCGALMVNYRMGGASGESRTSNFAAIADLANGFGTPNTPSLWRQYVGNIPWYGGSVLLPGFNMLNNEVVYFGGTDCRRYLDDPTATCNFANPGLYLSLGTNPVGGNNPPTPAVPASAAFTGSPPQRAGMAAARGQDGAGNVILIAWGGMRAPGLATDTDIYYLYKGAGGSPTWKNFTPSFSPAVVGNAAMVYSHVSRKFYLFGGYSPTPGTGVTNDNTWELAVSGDCTSVAGCSFTWKQLNLGDGVTCYPSCPPARRSHRMVEVNYNNRNPGGSVLDTGEPTCTNRDQPCSFGIFMEGGTSDGVSVLVDRWMFDPTANGGRGHWQLMGELPPRTLASMVSVDYYVPSSNMTAHRAILFGGETGLQSPNMIERSPSGQPSYFVAPTLGDTYMYDYDTRTWNRVALLGKGYNAGAPLGVGANRLTGAPEFDARQGFSALDNTAKGRQAAVLTPPPLSGAILVARTMSGPTRSASAPVKPLKIPEIFLFGGRLKDGSFHSTSTVYKFCAGTTGEKPFQFDAGTNRYFSQSGIDMTGLTDDASCDAFDYVENPSSQGPKPGYVGRWLQKKPAGAAGVSSFMGAGAYDSVDDVIVLVGGLGGGSAITSSGKSASATIYEYAPPKKAASNSVNPDDTEGRWTQMALCASSDTPAGRYGHTLAYDTLNQQLVMVGGYDSTGSPLSQTLTVGGTSTSMPEVWTAKRIDTDPANVCYRWSRVTVFGNALIDPAKAPPAGGLAHATAAFIPATGYNSGYYSMFDASCAKAGPIAVSDPSVNKLLAGGAYIDINRDALSPGENLLLNITFIPMGTSNLGPDSVRLPTEQSAFFKVHLVRTGQSGDTLRSVFQPRHLTYASTDLYPQIAQSIAILAPPTGQIRQEQVLIPLSTDPAIDRIRIERYSGTGILIDASLYRMGHK